LAKPNLLFTPRRLRTIVEEPLFSSQVSELAVDFSRLDEVMNGISFSLCHSPENFPVVPGTQLSVIKTCMYDGVPAIRIYFSYNAERVLLLCLEFCED